MADPVSTFLTVLLIGIALTIVVGQILVRSGQAILAEVFPRRETATSVTRLVVVLFHLVVLGVLALVVTIDFTLATPIQTIVVKLGLVLLVLGAAYAATLSLLARLRARRRMQLLVEQNNAQTQQYNQTQQYGRYGETEYYEGFGTPGTQANPSTAEVHPVIEPAAQNDPARPANPERPYR